MGLVIFRGCWMNFFKIKHCEESSKDVIMNIVMLLSQRNGKKFALAFLFFGSLTI